MTRFKGRNAIVTGGSSGIGAAISQRLTNEGGKVIVWDLLKPNNNKKNEIFGYIDVDISNWQSVQTAIENTRKLINKLDILVCSAGITEPKEKVWDYDVSDWKNVFAINVNGTFFCNKVCVPLMLENGF